MKRSQSVAIVLISLICANVTFGQAASPKQTVTAFYKYDVTHSQLITRRSVDARRRWLSDNLYRLFLEEIAYEKEQLRKNPTDKPYFGDGFPFQPYRETCFVRRSGRKYNWTHHIGKETISGTKASVRVSFDYPAVCKDEPTIYIIKLSRVRGIWRIDDLLYPGGSTLAASMKSHLDTYPVLR